MKLALIGGGAMGQLVERLALAEGHEVATVLGHRESAFRAEELAEILGGHDAAIDFTVAEAVPRHAEAYAPFVEEAHHSRKRDAPSGTALRLRDILAAEYDAEIPVASTRAGHIPGTHRVGFDSQADQILLTHTARSREGFAAGALVAARWIQGRQGVYEFSEVIDEILKGDGGRVSGAGKD